jgi:hypothetical protein
LDHAVDVLSETGISVLGKDIEPGQPLADAILAFSHVQKAMIASNQKVIKLYNSVAKILIFANEEAEKGPDGMPIFSEEPVSQCEAAVSKLLMAMEKAREDRASLDRARAALKAGMNMRSN